MPQLPPDVPGLVYLLIVAFIVVVPVLLPALMNRPVRRQQQAILEQVANSHETNLRDDVDEVRHLLTDVARAQEAVLEQQRETRRDIGGLRDELRTERRERLQLADRVDAQGRQLSQLDRRKD